MKNTCEYALDASRTAEGVPYKLVSVSHVNKEIYSVASSLPSSIKYFKIDMIKLIHLYAHKKSSVCGERPIRKMFCARTGVFFIDTKTSYTLNGRNLSNTQSLCNAGSSFCRVKNTHCSVAGVISNDEKSVLQSSKASLYKRQNVRTSLQTSLQKSQKEQGDMKRALRQSGKRQFNNKKQDKLWT